MKRTGLPLLLLVLLLMHPRLDAGEPPQEPILKLNTKMHNASIWRISLDAQGKYLATASDDKTAMLWDAQTGELLRVFRPPIDKGNEGKIYSCAISPDGRVLAAAGWTGWDWHRTSSVYLFDASTGEMMKRISGLDNVVFDLEFSPDGEYLSICLSRNGVRIYETSSWTQKASIPGYGDQATNSSFDRSGRLVTVCYDGKIRLYSSSFALVREIQGSGGGKPQGVAFSPDGTKIAVGYSDALRVQVFDAQDLSLLYEPDISGASGSYNYLSAVCWSLDGRFLYAGGYYLLYQNDQWWSQIRKWSDAGRGRFIDIASGLNTVYDLKVMPDESIVFCSYYPDFGRIDREGKKLYYRASEILSFADNDKTKLRVDKNAAVIGFAPYSGSTFKFSVLDRQLVEEKTSFRTPVSSRGDISVTDWHTSTSPKLNGRELYIMQQYERCISVDISHNGDYIVLGADWNLYCLDRDGNRRWQTAVPGVAWHVNIADGRDAVVVAYGDGTVRWHRLSDGQEILALFTPADGRRWVLWTPSGYYDCSPGGQDLIGWHVNNGAGSAASFYPVGRFANSFYRPQAVRLALEKLGEESVGPDSTRKKSTVAAEKKSILESLPPVVQILSPKNGEHVSGPLVKLSVLVKTPTNDPVTEIKTLVNGRPVGNVIRGLSIRPASKSGQTKTITVNVFEGESEISVLTKNSSGYSEPATVRVVYGKAPKREQEESVIQARLYLMAVGISQYSDRTLRLMFPAKDARDFSALFEKQKGSLYSDVQIRLITDEKATRGAIIEALEWIRKETTSKDVAMIFIAGYGMNDNSGNLYFLPHDADIDSLKGTAVPSSEISKTIASIAGKVIYFMDACHTGNLGGVRGGPDFDITGVLNELSSAENGVVVFSSSSGRQYSPEREKWGNGAFTKALIEGLSGKADYLGKKRITVNQLDLYVTERVKQLTGGKQTPATAKPGTIRDFPIIIQ